METIDWPKENNFWIPLNNIFSYTFCSIACTETPAPLGFKYLCRYHSNGKCPIFHRFRDQNIQRLYLHNPLGIRSHNSLFSARWWRLESCFVIKCSCITYNFVTVIQIIWKQVLCSMHVPFWRFVFDKRASYIDRVSLSLLMERCFAPAWAGPRLRLHCFNQLTKLLFESNEYTGARIFVIRWRILPFMMQIRIPPDVWIPFFLRNGAQKWAQQQTCRQIGSVDNFTRVEKFTDFPAKQPDTWWSNAVRLQWNRIG